MFVVEPIVRGLGRTLSRKVTCLGYNGVFDSLHIRISSTVTESVIASNFLSGSRMVGLHDYRRIKEHDLGK